MNISLFDPKPKTRSGIVARCYQIKDHDNSFCIWDGGVIGALTRGATGIGKCLGRGTPVLMFDGTIKKVEDVVNGDILIGPDSKPRRVLSLARGQEMMYRVTPTKGDSYVVNESHILSLKITPRRKGDRHELVNISVADYLQQNNTFKHCAKGWRSEVDWPESQVPVDPYYLGLWLGDGTATSTAISKPDEEVATAVAAVAAEWGLRYVETRPFDRCPSYGAAGTRGDNQSNPLKAAMRELGIMDGKHVPLCYKRNSRAVRLAVLAGLMDTDGTVAGGGFDFISVDRALSEDVAFLARSLGLAAYVAPSHKRCQTGVWGLYWRVSISGDCSVIPTRIPRKIAPGRRQIKDHLVTGISVEPIGVDDYYGFTIDGDGLFLLGDFTVTHNTLMACLKMDTWLQRGDNYRCMVVSYETQLVWQFAQEIEDFLGIHPGIEMDAEGIDADAVPKITVVSRASLLRAKPPTIEQRAQLSMFGITQLGAVPERMCKKFLRYLQKEGDPQDIMEEIKRVNSQPEASGTHWARLHKFDWRMNWLLIFDEAHRHAYHLASVGPIVDWFDQNPASRRNGITATPKRGDDVSIGHKMFPGIALDYPLYSPTKPCAVKDGYAVPYVQKYIEVAGVDFKTLGKIGEDFDEAELEKKLGEEETLAKLVLPLLDTVGNRRTLIFSPGVEMAKNVARFINARAETRCHACGAVKWHPRLLIGDGASCECNALLEPTDIIKSGEQAKQLDGSSPEHERKQIYQDHQSGKFQFLSVCGLCREGYNDPDIACVAIFRPVSKKASSLAEQMKGRACRPLRGLLNGLTTKEERLAAIAASAKPHALIVDLVGITGLADCASTVQIYADGLADEIAEQGHEDAEEIAAQIAARAEEILAEQALLGEMPVEEAINQAKREAEDAREQARLEREAAEKKALEDAERRAKAGAEVAYSEHEVGIGSQADPLAATESQYKYAGFLGMEIKVQRSKKQLGRIITMLKLRMDPAEIANLNHLQEEQWAARRPSLKQLGYMRFKNVPTANAQTPYDASLLIDARLDSEKYMRERRDSLEKARSSEELNAIAKDIRLVRGVLPEGLFTQIVSEGREKRESLNSNDQIPA